MKQKINRREFLNLVPLSMAPLPLMKGRQLKAETAPKNVLVLVFDAWSGHNVPFLGYSRDTTPNLTKLLDQAVVYHDHYAGAPYTTPGTATILTGTHTWTNRTLRPLSTPISSFKDKNIFHLFGEHQYHTFAYTHNPFAEVVINFFANDIAQNIPRYDLFFTKQWGVELFPHDTDSALVTQGRIMRGEDKISNSLYFGQRLSAWQDKVWNTVREKYRKWFKRGIPFTYDKEYFILETAIDWLIDNLDSLPKPFVGYYHLLPPHGPYSTRKDFMDIFKGEAPLTIDKPMTVPSGDLSTEQLERQRQEYDEYIAYVDAEFGRLYQHLEESGVLDSTWLVLTSDHGEMFERGLVGHSGFALYQSVLNVPLIIFEPGRTERLDIYDRTSAIDIIPTMLHVNGHEVPDWCQGTVIPPYRADDLPDRNVYALVARKSVIYGEMDPLTAAIYKGNHKLIYYQGYKKLEKAEDFEFYDLKNDPEELVDLYSEDSEVAQLLKAQLFAKLAEENEPFL